jgi:hypothetical protein
MSYDPTILACALLANDVYANTGKAPGFTRIHQYAATDDGFFGAAYQWGETVVVSLRGTQEMQDAIDDLNMIPGINGNAADLAMQKLVIEYCKGTRVEMAAIQNTGAFAKYLFSRAGVQKGVEKWGNRIPPNQARNAYTFAKQVKNLCQKEKLNIRCFTGHSLGGALAQYLSEQTGDGGLTTIEKNVPAVAFNSPSMGTIAGMRKGMGGGILCVNSRLDPLSLATKLAGNESHAKGPDYYIRVETWMMDPPPPMSPTPTPNEQGAFNGWFVKAAGRYHSMDNLYMALMSKFPGNTKLKHFFPNS